MTEPTQHGRDRHAQQPTPYDPADGTPPIPYSEGTVALVLSSDDREWAARAVVGICSTWARAGRRVVLADMHFDNPILDRLLGVDGMQGMVDLFLYGASVGRTAKPVQGEDFYVIPVGTYEPDAQVIYQNARWPKLIAGFRDAKATLVLFAPARATGISAIYRWLDECIILGKADAGLLDDLAVYGIAPTAHLVPPAREALTPTESLPSDSLEGPESLRGDELDLTPGPSFDDVQAERRSDEQAVLGTPIDGVGQTLPEESAGELASPEDSLEAHSGTPDVELDAELDDGDELGYRAGDGSDASEGSSDVAAESPDGSSESADDWSGGSDLSLVEPADEWRSGADQEGSAGSDSSDDSPDLEPWTVAPVTPASDVPPIDSSLPGEYDWAEEPAIDEDVPFSDGLRTDAGPASPPTEPDLLEGVDFWESESPPPGYDGSRDAMDDEDVGEPGSRDFDDASPRGSGLPRQMDSGDASRQGSMDSVPGHGDDSEGSDAAPFGEFAESSRTGGAISEGIGSGDADRDDAEITTAGPAANASADVDSIVPASGDEAVPGSKPASARRHGGGIGPHLPMILLVVLAAFVFAVLGYIIARQRPELVPWGTGAAPANQSTGATLRDGPLAVATDASRTGSALPYSVTGWAFVNFDAASDHADRERTRFSTAPIFVSPEEIQGVLYYKVLAGAVADTSAASRLRAQLVDAGMVEPTESIIQFSPLAFDLGEFVSRDSASARVDSLAELDVPAYMVSIPYSDGTRRWQLYGGAYRDSVSAEAMRRQLQEAGVSSRLVARIGEASTAR